MDNQFSQEQLHEWNRHIDSTMWTMAGISCGVLGGISIYGLEHPSWQIGSIGIILTLISGFLVLSFRKTRRQIQEKLDKEIVDLIRPPKYYKQWPAFFVLLIIFSSIWLYIIFVKIFCS